MRKHWSLQRGIIYLNHGPFGACPKAILARQSELRSEMEAEPVQFLWRHYEARLEPSRSELAKFVGARSKDLVFTTNATTGINAVARSLEFRRGDEILTTSLDYNACRNVLHEVVRQKGARLVVAEIPFPLQSDDEVIDAVLRKVTGKTRLALLDHVTSDTAIVLPVEKLIRELEARGVDSLIDGAHVPGMLPLNLNKLRPAYYAANLHKWVCTPKGAAFLWVREDRQDAIMPPVISHGNNRTRPGYTPFQDRFDWPATLDPTAWFCVGDAIRWMGQLLPGGWTELRRSNHALVVEARRLLADRLGVSVPCPGRMLGSMAVLPLPEPFQSVPSSGKIDAEQLRLYDEFGIELPFVRMNRQPPRWFRISAQVYNTRAEYAYLADVLNQIAAV